MDKQPRILVGYNLYFTSDEVTRVAIRHARAFGGKLYVVSSIVGHSLDKDGKVANVKARARLKNLKAGLEKEGLPYEVHPLVRQSTAGVDLVNFAHPLFGRQRAQKLIAACLVSLHSFC